MCGARGPSPPRPLLTLVPPVSACALVYLLPIVVPSSPIPTSYSLHSDPSGPNLTYHVRPACVSAGGGASEVLGRGSAAGDQGRQGGEARRRLRVLSHSASRRRAGDHLSGPQGPPAPAAPAIQRRVIRRGTLPIRLVPTMGETPPTRSLRGAQSWVVVRRWLRFDWLLGQCAKAGGTVVGVARVVPHPEDVGNGKLPRITNGIESSRALDR